MRVIYDSGLGRHARVSSIIEGNKWCWSCTNTIELMEIRGIMLGSPLEVKTRHYGFLTLAQASHVLMLKRCSMGERSS